MNWLELIGALAIPIVLAAAGLYFEEYEDWLKGNGRGEDEASLNEINYQHDH